MRRTPCDQRLPNPSPSLLSLWKGDVTNQLANRFLSGCDPFPERVGRAEARPSELGRFTLSFQAIDRQWVSKSYQDRNGPSSQMLLAYPVPDPFDKQRRSDPP